MWREIYLAVIQLWRKVMAGLSITQPGPLKAADVPFTGPQGPHSFQGPPFPLSLSFPIPLLQRSVSTPKLCFHMASSAAGAVVCESTAQRMGGESWCTMGISRPLVDLSLSGPGSVGQTDGMERTGVISNKSAMT